MNRSDRMKYRRFLNNQRLFRESKRERFMNMFCEKAGFFFFDIAKIFNAYSKKCLLKSGAKDRIESALKEYEKKEDIGKKVMDYDQGIADVISEPIVTLKAIESELIQTEKEKIDAQEYAKECYKVMQDMYQAWRENDDVRLGELFESFGFKEHKKRVK